MKTGAMSMSERIAMFNKSKAAPQANASVDTVPIKQIVKVESDKPNCRESFLKLAAQEKKISVNMNPLKCDNRKKTENEDKAAKPIKEKEAKTLKFPDQGNIMQEHKEKQLQFNQDSSSVVHEEKENQNRKSKEFKKGLTMMNKGKSEKIFGMASQLENRFKMMGMMGGPKTKQEENEKAEPADAKNETVDESSQPFFKKVRSHSLKGERKLSKLVELNFNQVEIMNMKPSVSKKKKTVKPDFQDRPSIV